MSLLFVSTGCPAGIGPEVSVAAAQRYRAASCVLVGDRDTLLASADQLGVARSRFREYVEAQPTVPGKIYLHAVGPKLAARDREPGRPTRRSGAAQLAYLGEAYRLTKQFASAGAALVTGPVNKAIIARSGAPKARGFRGHTEWLGEQDGAASTVMCFAAPKLVTSLATTHISLKQIPKQLTSLAVSDACVALARLLHGLGVATPRLAVCSLNPHAGEDALFGEEEARAIIPGMRLARRKLRGQVELLGPLGAETAYRKGAQGGFDGVVAMYHDQATIPMKLVAFGEAVNITQGLSVVRTSVDHGTAYDIAGKACADANGMLVAMQLAAKLAVSTCRFRLARPYFEI